MTLTVTVAVNNRDVAWLEAQRRTPDRPLPAGTHPYRWARYERDAAGELRCTGSGTLYHDEADGAVELAAKLLRAATRPDVTVEADVSRPQMRGGPVPGPEVRDRAARR